MTRGPGTPELTDAAFDRLRKAIDWPDLSLTRYEVIRELARGGMGVVYEARDCELGRPVALKVLASAVADPDTAERLRREARIIAGLEHPGIVPLHDVGTLPDGRVFYAMKLVSGARLDGLVREGSSLVELLRIFLRITEPVAFAHAHGVIHRDLKPENLMVGRFGEVLVMDWGVAKRLGEGAGPEARGEREAEGGEGGTAHGTILGTPAYMAPEQARGEVKIDARADVYALGAILYFILTRVPPGPVSGTSETTRTLPTGRDAARSPVVPPRHLDPSVHPALEAVCLKALSANPAERYPGVVELGADVERFLGGLAVSAYPESLWARVWRVSIRHRTPILVILAYVVMRLLLLLLARV